MAANFSEVGHRFEWTVFDFALASPDVNLESSWFRTWYNLDAEYRMVLAPTGDMDPLSISLWLQRKSSDHGPAKIRVKFELGIVDRLGEDREGKVLTAEFERSGKYGHEAFLERSELMKFLHRGTLTLYCKVFGESYDTLVRVNFETESKVFEIMPMLVDEPPLKDLEPSDLWSEGGRISAESLPPGFVVKYQVKSDTVKIQLVPLEAAKEDMDVFGKMLVAEKLLLSHSQTISKGESTNFDFPDVVLKPDDKKKVKLNMTVIYRKGISTTPYKGKNEGKPPSLRSRPNDLILQAKDGSLTVSSLYLMANSPVIYRALKEDDWLHFGLMGREKDPKEEVEEVALKVARSPGYLTVLELPDLPKSALERVCNYFQSNESTINMKDEEVEDVYRVGQILKIPLVCDICVADYWRLNMTTSSVLHRLKFASTLTDQDHREILTNICLKHIHRFMGEILTSERWGEFLAKDKDLAEVVLNYLRECEGQREIV